MDSNRTEVLQYDSAHNAIEVPIINSNSQGESTPEIPPKRKFSKTIIFIIVLLFLLLGVIPIGIFFIKSDSDSQTESKSSRPPQQDQLVESQNDGQIIISGKEGIAVTSLENNSIHLFNLDGSQEKVIKVDNAAFIRGHQWSPDRKTLVYICNQNKETITTDICTINMNGSNQKVILKNDGFNVRPAWSPDGTKISFLFSNDAKKVIDYSEKLSDTFDISFAHFGIYTMNNDGTEVRKINDKNQYEHKYSPLWSPDSAKLAVNARSNGEGPFLQIINLNDLRTENIDRGSFDTPYLFSWSKITNLIIYTNDADASGNVFDVSDNVHHLFSINPDSGIKSDITPKILWQYKSISIASLSNEDKIVLIATPSVLGKMEIYKMDLDGNNLIKLDSVDVCGGPKWSKDGSKIAFLKSFGDSDYCEVIIMNGDGSNQRRITKGLSTGLGLGYEFLK